MANRRNDSLFLSQRRMGDRGLRREGVCECANTRKGFPGMSKITKYIIWHTDTWASMNFKLNQNGDVVANDILVY